MLNFLSKELNRLMDLTRRITMHKLHTFFYRFLTVFKCIIIAQYKIKTIL